MEHESPTAPALQMTRPRPRESLRVWEERGKGHECLLMPCGVRFRPDDVLLSPSAKGGADRESWEDPPDHVRRDHWVGECSTQLKGSPGLEGTSQGSRHVSALPALFLRPAISQAQSRTSHHPKLDLGDLLPRGPVSLWMGEQGEPWLGAAPRNSMKPSPRTSAQI